MPIGYRNFREAMQKTPPDLAAAAGGLRQGRSHEDDIPGGIRLFRWFHRTPLMAEAIVTWTEGDRLIEQMRVLADKAHAQPAQRRPGRARGDRALRPRPRASTTC